MGMRSSMSRSKLPYGFMWWKIKGVSAERSCGVIRDDQSESASTLWIMRVFT